MLLVEGDLVEPHDLCVAFVGDGEDRVLLVLGEGELDPRRRMLQGDASALARCPLAGCPVGADLELGPSARISFRAPLRFLRLTGEALAGA